MVRKRLRNRRVPKETGSNVSAGKGDKVTSKKDPVNNSDSPPQVKKDLSDVVKRLQETWAATPEKLDKLAKAEEQHTQVLVDLGNSIADIDKVLAPGRDIITRGLAKKLTTAERNTLLLQRAQFDSLKRKVESSYQPILVKLVSSSKNERKAISRDNLRDTVKDPNYYKRYGKDIVPAFERMLKNPMTEIVFNGLLELKGITEDTEFNSFIGKFLLWNNIELYIRSTGNPEAKLKYFAEFRTILLDWDPEKAVIKKESK